MCSKHNLTPVFYSSKVMVGLPCYPFYFGLHLFMKEITTYSDWDEDQSVVCGDVNKFDNSPDRHTSEFPQWQPFLDRILQTWWGLLKLSKKSAVLFKESQCWCLISTFHMYLYCVTTLVRWLHFMLGGVTSHDCGRFCSSEFLPEFMFLFLELRFDLFQWVNQT